MYQLTDIRPIQMNDLVRIGAHEDGGYVISQSQLDNTKILLSFGVNEDWSFDKDFLNKTSDCYLYAYDASVSANIIRKRILKHILSFLFRTITLDFKVGKLSATKAYSNIRHPFQQFFNPKKNRYFFEKYLGAFDDEKYVSIQHIFNNHINHTVKELSVFVKMDIEQSEYRTLQSFKPFYHFINGFAIEFHDLDILGDNFTEIVRELTTHFHIVHVHANNYAGYIYHTQLPKILEITFISKKMLSKYSVHTQISYPIPGLDFACNKNIPDIPIIF